MDLRQLNASMPTNPINTKRTDFASRQRIDEEFNYLYDDTAKDFGGYEDEEEYEYDSMSCYE